MGTRLMSRSAAVVAGGVVWLGLFAGGASASSVFLCVPSTAGKPVVSGGASPGTCSAATKVALPASSTDQQTLLSILPHLSFSASGVGGQPTIRFSGVNVQIVDGNSSNSTSIVNGTGNLVLGYDEAPGSQTGSHDLILGEKQTHTSYGDIVGGYDNQATSPYAIALGEGTTAASTTAWSPATETASQAPPRACWAATRTLSQAPTRRCPAAARTWSEPAP